MPTTSNSVANQALQLAGDNMPEVTGYAPTFDNSTAGQALQRLYGPCVETVGRQFGWDFSRNTIALTPSGNTPAEWAYEYIYPGIELWQLVPVTMADPNNPLPINWNIANTLVAGAQTKVIQTNLASALGVYNNAPTEATWDPLFREAVVRLLGSELSEALNGKPDTAQFYLQSGGAFESLGEARPD